MMTEININQKGIQNPEAHKDRFGKPIKYYSPAGSGTQLYIPQKIRHIYQIGRPIENLYIQEGEITGMKSSGILKLK